MDQKLLRILGGDTHHYPYATEQKYPRIFATLMLLWDTPEMTSYFDKLMVDERGDRAGFPPDVAAEIVHLSLIHAAQHQKSIKNDVWSPEARIFTHFDPLASIKTEMTWPSIPQNIFLNIQALGIACTPEGLFRAAETGNQTAIELFLSAGVPLETRNAGGWTILMSAIYNNHQSLALCLLEAGAKSESFEEGGNTALHWAAFAGRLECCQLLVAYHAQIDARSNFGWTPLYQAVARNHIKVASFLIAKNADINTSGKDKQTPLHKAAAGGSIELIKLLLNYGADAQRINQLGETPLVVARKHNQDEAVAILRKNSF